MCNSGKNSAVWLVDQFIAVPAGGQWMKELNRMEQQWRSTLHTKDHYPNTVLTVS